MTSIETPIEKSITLDARKKAALFRIGIKNIRDLLFYFPNRYTHISERKNIVDLHSGDTVSVYGKITSLRFGKTFRTRMSFAEGTIEDHTASIKALWYRQPYIAKMFQEGNTVLLSGTVGEQRGSPCLINPEIEKTKTLPIDAGDSLFSSEEDKNIFAFPIYPETRGLSSRFLFHAISKILKQGVLDEIEDPLPQEMLKKYSLPTLKTALVWIHMPKNDNHAALARKRFSFEEIFFIQLSRQSAKREYEKNSSFKVHCSNDTMREFLDRFPFRPTQAQTRAINEILKDINREKPMMRLLEGDVGSGKTLVAAASAYAVWHAKANTSTRLQCAYMAPTEILATQHFESFIKYFSHLPLTIGLVTGSGCKKFPSKVNPETWTSISKNQLLKWVKDGSVDVLFGTHALIQKSVSFSRLAFALIDEQHRFGTEQRKKLVTNVAKAPHLLSMTATPIPRTLSLTIYGDLDLTVLDQMPPGRKTPKTTVVPHPEREKMYTKTRRELENGRQVYIICPRIDEPDPNKELALVATSVKEERERIKRNIFPEYEVGILHGKMTPAEKENEMRKFSDGSTHILVATSVVEVGVNVENASVIIIEGAERFGLSQLHQLRGRVLRSTHQAYCYLVTESDSKKTKERLRAMKTAKNGFELSEIDLTLRGAGELSGKKQWGVSDLGMEAIKNIKMVEAAREEAKALLEKDPTLLQFPLIQKRLRQYGGGVHFE